MVQEQKFRQDLLYRINTVELHLPALRERAEDIPALVAHFLQVYSQKYKRPLKTISPEALKKLQRYNWPGNIRELQHVIERATIISANARLQAEDFYFLEETAGSPVREEPDTLNLDEMEKDTVRRAMQKHNGNISKVAKELGLSRASLYRRLEKYEL
jgi:transcriptional regulator with PAS, ATPase and Fis domain